MKVSEFIEWLSTQDQEADVKVLIHSDGSGYYDQGGNTFIERFNPNVASTHEYTEPFTTPLQDYNSELILGSMNN